MGFTLSGFDVQRAAMFYGNVLAIGAEEVTFYPKDDVGRPLTIRFEHTVAQTPSGELDRDVEMALVICGRDESHAKGGIERAEQGQTLVRAGEEDEPQRWAFTGVVIRRTPYSYHLQYRRTINNRIGAKNRERS